MTSPSISRLRWARWSRQILFVLGLSGLALLLCLQALQLTARWTYLGDMATAFVYPRAVFSLLLTLLFLALRFARTAAISALVMAWLFTGILHYLPYHRVFPVATESRAPLRVMQFNVSQYNRRSEGALIAIRNADPDVVCLQEIDKFWQTVLRGIERAYPHQWSMPDDRFNGMAVLSKYPIIEPRYVNFAYASAVYFAIDHAGQRIDFVNPHVWAPVSAGAAARRNKQLGLMAEQVQKLEGLTIVAGDLNSAMWSPHFKDFCTATGLRCTRRGYGIYASWIANLPILPHYLQGEELITPAFAPIDHILVSPEISVADFRRGPRVGSDHHPVWADLLIPAAAQSAP